MPTYINRSWDGSVDIMTRLQVEQQRNQILFLARARDISLQHPDWLRGPPSLHPVVPWGSFLGITWLRQEGDLPPPSGDEVKIE
jgi:hypothetical protein